MKFLCAVSSFVASAVACTDCNIRHIVGVPTVTRAAVFRRNIVPVTRVAVSSPTVFYKASVARPFTFAAIKTKAYKVASTRKAAVEVVEEEEKPKKVAEEESSTEESSVSEESFEDVEIAFPIGVRHEQREQVLLLAGDNYFNGPRKVSGAEVLLMDKADSYVCADVCLMTPACAKSKVQSRCEVNVVSGLGQCSGVYFVHQMAAPVSDFFCDMWTSEGCVKLEPVLCKVEEQVEKATIVAIKQELKEQKVQVFNALAFDTITFAPLQRQFAFIQPFDLIQAEVAPQMYIRNSPNFAAYGMVLPTVFIEDVEEDFLPIITVQKVKRVAAKPVATIKFVAPKPVATIKFVAPKQVATIKFVAPKRTAMKSTRRYVFGATTRRANAVAFVSRTHAAQNVRVAAIPTKRAFTFATRKAATVWL